MSQEIVNKTKNLIMNQLDFLINAEGMEINEAIQELKNAELEYRGIKATPLKVIKTGPWNDIDCAYCGNTVCYDEDVENGNTPNYCKHCGQKLDWSDVE